MWFGCTAERINVWYFTSSTQSTVSKIAKNSQTNEKFHKDEKSCYDADYQVVTCVTAYPYISVGSDTWERASCFCHNQQ